MCYFIGAYAIIQDCGEQHWCRN